jgi:putative membrane protein
MRILAKIVATGLAVWVACLLPGIGLGGGGTGQQALTLLVVAVIIGVINAVLKPIIKTIGCLFYILTLGLITFVVNGLLLLLAEWIADKLSLGFHVDGFWWAVLGSIVISVVSWAVHLIIPDKIDKGDRS